MRRRCFTLFDVSYGGVINIQKTWFFNNWCIAEEERRKPHEGVDGGAGGWGGGESLPRIKRMPLPHFGRPLFEEIGALLLCGCGRLYCCDSRLPWCQEHWQGSKICSKGGEMLKIPILVAVVITVVIFIKLMTEMCCPYHAPSSSLMTSIIPNFNFQSALNSVVSCKRQSWIWSNRLPRGFSYSKLQSRSTSTSILQSASCTAVTELNEPYFGLVERFSFNSEGICCNYFFLPLWFSMDMNISQKYWPNPIIHNNCKGF